MRYFSFIMLLLVSCFTLKADDSIKSLYPIRIDLEAIPEEIRYGDICFITFSVTNEGKETLYLPYGRTFLHWGRFWLSDGTKEILSWRGEDYDNCEGTMTKWGIVHMFPGKPVKPGETMAFLVRMVWLPQPEFAQDKQTKELLQWGNKGKQDYHVQFDAWLYHAAYRITSRPRHDKHSNPLYRKDFPVDELSFNEFEAKGYKWVNTINNPKCPVRIFPRSQEELKLLQEWYLELPTEASIYHWTMEHVFAHPFHVRDSPFKMPNASPLELRRKREPLEEAYRAFFKSMETRTPESLARIKRTNDLASQIIERSKQPNSTISQNMVEFIQLRGFLVDMRYAENEQAEQAAFEKLMNFVDTAKDRELWIQFLDEIGLYSIMHQTHFPSRKVEHYRELFAKRFPEVKTLD